MYNLSFNKTPYAIKLQYFTLLYNHECAYITDVFVVISIHFY